MRFLSLGLMLAVLLGLLSCATSTDKPHAQQSAAKAAEVEMTRPPGWSLADLDFFLHGSMSTEVVPETVLRAFLRAYPDLFPSEDLSHLGLIPDPAFGWPIGFSRREVPRLGGLSSLGLNCAGCHVADITFASRRGGTVRVLGATSHFDAEAYFGAVAVATFRSADPAQMRKFLPAYLAVNEPAGADQAQARLASEWDRQEQRIVEALSADPSGSKGLAPGGFHDISAKDLRLDAQVLASEIDLAALSHSFLKLFHNMRASLHIPDQPPEKAPPASGPGRNDAFGLLSLVLFGEPQPYAPVKYGLVWNVDQRHWVHWDGNTQSPIGRNLLAALGLGAPLLGKHGDLDFAQVKHQTDLSETIRPPRYPLSIDQAAANRGATYYHAQCAACHDGPEGDRRLRTTVEIGTEPHRAEAFTPTQADRFNKFLGELETPGYQPSSAPGIRSTQKYWAATLAGVWARSPYLHNGSVRTMRELLTAPAARAKSFRRGSRMFDPEQMGYTDAGPYVLDTASPGNSNAGHNYGTGLSPVQRRDLIEYLKTL